MVRRGESRTIPFSANLLLGCIKSTSTLLFELSILPKPCKSSAAGCRGFFLAQRALFVPCYFVGNFKL